ncbi:fructosamine kinase family protein [Nitrosomonas sp. JL21]|nr:fructosamine kinase family protein [Nitrosomonas sp. JL21]
MAADISASTQTSFVITRSSPIGGGCINQAYCITDGRQHYFVKLNTREQLCMFEDEAAGLMEIYRSRTLRVPSPICHGSDADSAWLVLEYIDISGRASGKGSDLGKQLAAMHRTTSTHFGWIRNNTIGATPQVNSISSNWVDFWRTHRLGYQLDLARKNGFNGKLQTLGENILLELDKLLAEASPAASLLHGDLWSGNYAFDEMGNPIIFDPAIYYGDREADIAMTELFGGFPADFYSAYRHEYPLDSGYNTRKIVYNLYHILNHLNLFGSNYRHQAEQMMGFLLAEIR